VNPETPLTPDEERVLQLLVEGRKSGEMAATLGISPDKLREHVQSMMTKFQVQTRLELLAKTGRLWPGSFGIDCEEDRTLRAVLVGMLREASQGR
jgi:DNA-binding CsgD family transcriptional regulator